MRGKAETLQMIAPGSLTAVLDLLAGAPGVWTPIAGGTEIMVAHAAGRLDAKRMVSLWGIGELRFIDTRPEVIVIGAGSTFKDIRAHAGIMQHLPLLAQAASWIGSIANQSRATIGGNLVNGSPAADSSPALLAYDAAVELISVRGVRRVAYSAFHTGYKRSALAADELLHAVYLPTRFARHSNYQRKVGTRRAMAISKVAIAATALLEHTVVKEVRIGAASMAAFPTRLYRTEDAVCGAAVSDETIARAKDALLKEVVPIDDIRSTAEYRRQVAVNLVTEFLTQLHSAR